LYGAAATPLSESRPKIKMRVLSKKIRWPSEWAKRVDKIASDLNVVLVVFAVGLATLDLTFLVTQKVIDRLPQVTRVNWEAAPASANPADPAKTETASK
jgi:hypothetical protein